jgi:hypothetical protein
MKQTMTTTSVADGAYSHEDPLYALMNVVLQTFKREHIAHVSCFIFIECCVVV